MESALIMAPASPLLDAALAILSDGKPRSADEILAEAVKRGLLDANQTRKHLYTALSQYIQRALGRGNKPLLVEESDHRFRLNRPMAGPRSTRPVFRPWRLPLNHLLRQPLPSRR